VDTKLSQEEIDRLLLESAGNLESLLQSTAVSYDFRRPDRLPKEQMRSIHLMHDFLARNLASTLGAYLRAYVTATLVSVEQLSFSEFVQYLPSPTAISSVAMSPVEGSAVLELNPSLVFPILDILLGGKGASAMEAREMTEIEQSVIEGVLRLILHDLKEAWSSVANVDFKVASTDTQPHMVQILSPNEAVVAIGFEITVGENRGMMNFGIPSILVKMMGQRFEQQWSIGTRSHTPGEVRSMQLVARQIPMTLDPRVTGARMTVRSLLAMERGDVVSLDIPVRRPANVLVNGVNKFEAEVVLSGSVRSVMINGHIEPDSGKEAAA
jgi:flagellar motor switch protein FliM